MPDTEYNEPEERPIGKWGYIYYIVMGTLFLVATVIFCFVDWT